VSLNVASTLEYPARAVRFIIGLRARTLDSSTTASGRLHRHLRRLLIATLRRRVVSVYVRRLLSAIPHAVLLKIVSYHRRTFVVFHGGSRKFPQMLLYYPTVDDAARAMDELCQWASGNFVRGFQHALKGEVHQGAAALLDWTHEAADVVEARVFDGGCPPRLRCCGFIFKFGCGLPARQVKLEFLNSLFADYEQAVDGHPARRRILETLGFVLYRSLAAVRERGRAIEFVHRDLLGSNLVAVLRCDAGGWPLTVCPTAKEIDKFIDQWPELDRCAVIRGLRRALVDEVYDGAYDLFDWIFTTAEIPVNAFFAAPSPASLGYPVFELGRSGPNTPEDKTEFLVRIFDAYEQALANHPPRYAILETIAFALSRGMGALGRHGRAIEYVKRVLQLRPRSIYLNACLHVLELKARGLSVPRRLEKFCGRDPQTLDQVVCSHPFTHIEITPGGNVHVCCASLVPSVIGNIENQDPTEIVHSEMARKLRRSVLDGSYKYCDHLTCQVMIRDKLLKKTDVDVLHDPVIGSAISTGNVDAAEIRYLAFGYDLSCNLSCPSCRRETLIDHHKQSSERSHHVRRKLMPLLTNLQSLYINNSGEFLFSRPSRELLQSIDPARSANLKIDLISNGTLFSEQEWQKFSNIHGMVRNIRISIDAATKQTFEVLRRGGRWERFVENLRFIAQMRRRGEIDCFMLAFTYQLRNFREMPDVVSFARDLAVDVISFERIAPSSAMSYDEYSAQAVHLPTHPLYAQFLDVLKEPAMALPIVRCEFEGG
jgi:Iron-sulfur cluster-binding domain